MSTLGKTTTPTTSSFGWITNSTHAQVAMAFTTTQSGLYSSVSFWAAGNSPLGMHGCIWDATGAPLAFGQGVITSGGQSGGVGATQWWTDTLQNPTFIAAGALIFLGWQANSDATTSWAYNGNDHSPNALWANNPSASQQNGLQGNLAMTPNGAVAVFATYTPATAHVRRGSGWSPASFVGARRTSSWTAASFNGSRRGTGWTPGQ